MIKDHFEIIRKNKIAFWWFKSRRDLFFKILKTRIKEPLPLALDAGCGPLTNEDLYQDFGQKWVALDSSLESFKDDTYENNIQPVIGELTGLPAGPDKLDLVLMLDVLEHIENEKAVMFELKRVLKNGGFILISVPAFRCLWSFHDEQAGHKRRYKKRELEALCREFDFEIVEGSYFNSALFLPIYIIRKILRIVPGGKHRIEISLSPAFLDSAIYYLLKLESFLNFHLFKIPFGTSFVILLRKKNG
jgi:SAM-dependent methyltransferase